MKKAFAMLLSAVMLLSVVYFPVAAAGDLAGEWVCWAVDRGDGVLKQEYNGTKVETISLLIRPDGTLRSKSGSSEAAGTWEEIEGGVRVRIDGQPALDFLLEKGQLVLRNGAGDIFYLGRSEEAGASEAEGTEFFLFRKGITWTSTPEQVREAEGVGQEIDDLVHPKYPDFRLLEIQEAFDKGDQGSSLNYLFHKDSLLAIFYDSPYESGSYMSLVNSMLRQYGEPMPAESDWVTGILKSMPARVLTHFELEDNGHKTWMIREDTAAFVMEYNRGGSAALACVNLGLLEGMGLNADGAWDAFLFGKAEENPAGTEEGAINAQGTRFRFSRNGITWASTPRQVREAEGVSSDRDYWIHRDYPDFQLLDLGDATAAGVQAYSLNYLFRKDRLLAIFYDFVEWESGNAAKRDSLQAAMTQKYGRPMPEDTDWVTQTLKRVPGEVLTAFHLEDVEHQTWRIHEDTAAFLITYSRRGGFALAYVNLGLLAEMGYGGDGETLPDAGTPPDGI